MPGWELINQKEKKEINSIFEKSNGVMFAHAFEKRRNNIFRVRNFEKAICKYLGVKYCLATTSGTIAQYISMKALGIKAGDEIITQAFTFVATVEAILAIGAKPVITNVNESLNMCPKELNKLITKKTKLIIPVPMLGNPCDMRQIMKIAKKRKVPILEDACESFGAKYKGKFVGTHGDVGVYSLDFAKTITTGEGGLIVTNNKKIFKYCKEFHDHGHENNKKKPRGKDTRSIWGLNLRMTELQAAVGLAQLKKISFIKKKNKMNKDYLKKSIAKNPQINFRKIYDREELSDTLIFFLKNKNLAKKMEKYLTKNKIDTKNLPDAIDWHFAGNWGHIFKDIKLYKKNFKTKWNITRNYLERAIAIPIYVNDSQKKIKSVSLKINNYFNNSIFKK